jgi:hypothetical protein
LKVGDRLPIGYKSPKPNITIEYLNMKDYFSLTEYVYGSELWKAREYRDKYALKVLTVPKDYKKPENSKNAIWWHLHHNIDFTLPFTRSDHAMRTLEGYKSVNAGKEFYQQNKIYIKTQTVADSQIPDNIELNEAFGFFIGIYLADGCCMDNYITISKYDINVLNKVQKL